MSLALIAYLVGFAFTWPLVFRAMARNELRGSSSYLHAGRVDGDLMFLLVFSATFASLVWPLALLYLFFTPLFRRWAHESIKEEETTT